MHRRARVASTVAVAAALLAVTFAVPSVASAEPKPAVDVPVVHVEGRGHGHGVGMSQWGAYTMARDGASAADILGAFYPGTQLGSAGGNVVVGLLTAGRTRVQFPEGGEVRSALEGPQAAGFPVAVPAGGVVELVRDGSGYHVVGGSVAPLGASGSATRYSTADARDCFFFWCRPDDTTTTTTPPTTTTTAPPSGGSGGSGGSSGGSGGSDGSGGSGGDSGGSGGSGGSPGTAPPSSAPGASPSTAPSDPRSSTPLWAVPNGGGTVRSVARARTYRGVFEFAGDPGSARLRNHVDVEQYLKGMAEVPGSWPAAAVQAQAIAARTYALRAMANGGEICDGESCQVYDGIGHESAGQSAAVDATAGQVVLHGGGFAATYYSASDGGFSATVAEGFGTAADIPYLRAEPHPNAHPDPWSVDLALTDVAARLGYGGRIHDVRVDRKGPSGRALQMTVVGDAGDLPVDPQDFRRQLGLRSTLFTVTTSKAEKPPPPPDPADDPGVVGAKAVDVDPVVAPLRRPERPLGTTTFVVGADSTSRVPAPLLALATLLVLCVAGAWTVLAVPRHRLEPARAVVVGAGRGLGRVTMRATSTAVATMTAWRNRRR